MRLSIVIALLLAAVAAQAAVGGGDITLKNQGGDVVFSHGTHVDGAKLACTECHDKLYLSKGQHRTVTMKLMKKKGISCGACHNDMKAFSVKGNCTRCHKK